MKRIGNSRIVLILFVTSFTLFTAGVCFGESNNRLLIFHAGSLSVPFKDMSRAFREKHPNLSINIETAGSRTCARKITDLKRPCDVMASADYTVIENLLIPEYASWNISFAANEMAIMYRPNSLHCDEINGRNWYEILLRQGVEYGHSNPNMDPCGYRSLLVWQLAEKYYKKPGLYQKLKEKCPSRNVRPKETELIALLEAGQIDYAFIYRSVCEQHKMPFVVLPDQINLKSHAYEDFYRRAKIKVTGKTPGEFIEHRGKAMVYGITIPKRAPNLKMAIEFVAFVVGPKGAAIMKQNGQPPIFPPIATGKVEYLPAQLKKLVK